MPQVQLNTRVDIDTYNQLKEVSEKLNKSIASIVDEALNKYFEEVSPMGKSITLQIKPEWDGNQSYDLVAYSYNSEIVIYSGHKWLKEDAILSIQAFADELVVKGYKISDTTIKKYNLQF